MAKFGGVKTQDEKEWRFLEIAEFMKTPSSNPKYLKQLGVSEHIFGKALEVFPWLWAAIILVVLVVLGYSWEPIIKPFLNSSYTVIGIVMALVLWALMRIAPKLERLISLFRYLRPHALLAKRFAGAVALVVGTVFVVFYLKFINPLYLAQGRIAKLKKED